MEMMLSKNYDEKKVQFPCYVSRKYDGVPVIFWLEYGELKHATRQGKQLESIPHIIEEVKLWLDNQEHLFDGFVLCGELYIPHTPFKVISGFVRRHEPCLDLDLRVFELSPHLRFVDYTLAKKDSSWDDFKLRLVEQKEIHTQEGLNYLLDNLDKNWEGLMIRHGEYQHGKRSWNSMKFKKDPTVDLKVLGVEEAYSKDGEPKGMIGAFICEFHGRDIKVGAGKMNHADRKELWENPPEYGERIIEVKYMKDDSYDDLRQPTFQRWRDDKNEVNEEV